LWIADGIDWQQLLGKMPLHGACIVDARFSFKLAMEVVSVSSAISKEKMKTLLTQMDLEYARVKISLANALTLNSTKTSLVLTLTINMILN